MVQRATQGLVIDLVHKYGNLYLSKHQKTGHQMPDQKFNSDGIKVDVMWIWGQDTFQGP